MVEPADRMHKAVDEAGGVAVAGVSESGRRQGDETESEERSERAHQCSFRGPTVLNELTQGRPVSWLRTIQLAFPIANQWPLRRILVRYSRGGGTGIAPASRFTLSGTVAAICVRSPPSDQ
jgi:hypothetical protein